jgi:hypothetical protein
MQRCTRLCTEAGHAVAQVKLPERRPDSDVLVKGGEDGEKRARVSKAATAGAEGGGKVSFSLGAKAPAP